MRHARLKPDCHDTWHHCFNRAVGDQDDRPFSDADKEQFVRILMRISRLYAVRIVAYQVMSNHFHLLLQAPAEEPGETDTIQRYNAFYAKERRELRPGSAECREWQQRLRDISWCLRHLQHLYSAWYNRTRPVRRRGPVWAGRFKNTVLESGVAVWNCWQYIEANPLRAKLVADPGNYRFSSYGVWCQSGRHPFAEALQEHLIPALPAGVRELTPDEVQLELREGFAATARELGLTPENCGEEHDTNGVIDEVVDFATTVSRRMRFWTDGFVIGSELFVRNMVARYRPELPAVRHRVAKAEICQGLEVPVDTPICSWRRLRAIKY